jgi:integrase
VLALGTYPNTSLARARELVREARVKLQQGIDPAVERRKAKLSRRAAAGETFAVVAEEWFRVKAAHASENYKRDIRGVLNAHLLPRLGPLPVSEIEAPVLLGALRAVEARGKLELARRCRMWLRQILDFATASGMRSGDNPARALTADVLLRPPKRENHPALRVDEAGVFLRRLVDYPGKSETRLAITLLLLTAVRPGEIQRARWQEIDAREKVWRIPAAKMKARRDHVVALSTQAIAALEQLRTLTGHSEWPVPRAQQADAASVREHARQGLQVAVPRAPYRPAWVSRLLQHAHRRIAQVPQRSGRAGAGARASRSSGGRLQSRAAPTPAA